jgi:hypothetical protein
MTGYGNQMSEPNSAPHPLGSHRRWVETLLLLVAPFLITYIFLCVLLHNIGLSWILVLCVAPIGLLPPCCAVLWSGLNSADEYLHIPWLSDIAVNLAYGTAEEDGIHFRKWLRSRFVTWRAIERLEYWPERDGQISLHLYSQSAPIIFVPAQSYQNEVSEASDGESTTVEFISRKLNEEWPGKSTFVISYEPPRVRKQGSLTEIMGRLSVRQRALANALLVLLTLICFYTYLAIPVNFWMVIGVLWTIGLVVWAYARISKLARFKRRTSDNKASPGRSGLVKK